jgi:hypothetical protein
MSWSSGDGRSAEFQLCANTNLPPRRAGALRSAPCHSSLTGCRIEIAALVALRQSPGALKSICETASVLGLLACCIADLQSAGRRKHLARPNLQLRSAFACFLLASAFAAPAFDIILTTNVAPPGYVEVRGVEAGDFDPRLWQAGTLNFVPDARLPLLAPLTGKFRNIYAPSAVETPTGYRLFYGAWDGMPTGNDRIYSAETDAHFQTFSNRHPVVLPGNYTHVCNVNALRLEDGSFAMHATVYPIRDLNKPAFFQSDATGTNWNGASGEPYTVQSRDILRLAGYDYDHADINGLNVMVREDGVFRLYFGDFKKPGAVFRATSADGRQYAFEAQVVSEAGFVNDVKKFRVGATNYYLMGLHENGSRVRQAVSPDGLAFPGARVLFTNLDASDRYIVAVGWVARGSQEPPGRKLLGVLYGAGPTPALNQNQIYARWLQKRVVFVAEDGTRYLGSKSFGPDRQLLAIPGPGPAAGQFEVYAEDGLTLLGKSATLTARRGQTFEVRRLH